MPTNFPTNPDSYTTKVDGVDNVMAAHINDLQDAMMAVQDFALDLRDGLGKWQSYTVSWTASTTNPSIGNGILNGRYVQIGKTVMGTIEMIVGSTTTYGSGGWYFSLPKAVASNAFLTGNWVAIDASPLKFYAGLLRAYGNEDKISQFIRDAGLYWLADITPHTWADGDSLRISFTYEVA